MKAALLFALLATVAYGADNSQIPHLRRQGTATQLVVDGKPFLIRGGELGNSSATNANYLKPYWRKLQQLNLNTVVCPVYWDLIEPAENRFDWSVLDQVISDARSHDMHLVLLWFGSWKNSMSCYVPSWIKANETRFPRSEDSAGHGMEILSPFSETNRETDEHAFTALMSHLRDFDAGHHTVLMVQVENEIGMIPEARDHSPAANKAYAGQVPEVLTRYLKAHEDSLDPKLRTAWLSHGRKMEGTWTEVLGDTEATQEYFMAWYFGRYTDAVAAAGKAVYPLPMYVNAALIRPGYRPGQYPSAGPLPHLFDIWKAAAPAIDILSPDIYFKDFIGWTGRFVRDGNPLFIPEALQSPMASVNALYAIGQHDAIGFSPFAIESIGGEGEQMLKESYSVIRQLTPLILKNDGRGTMAGLLSSGPEQKQPLHVDLGGYRLTVAFERTQPPSLAAGGTDTGPRRVLPSGGLVIVTGPDEFVFAGTGIVVTFKSLDDPHVTTGILSDEEGRYVDGNWENIRWLGGDQTNQGRFLRLPPGRFSIQRIKLYRYH